MQTTFEVQLSKKEYVVGLEALFVELAKIDPTRNRMIFQRLAIVVFLVLATGWFFPEALTGLFFIIVGFAVLEGLLGRFWLKSAHGASYDPSVGPQLLEFTDTKISDTSPMRKREWSWDAVRRVHDREAALVFELVGWDMIVLPSHLWTAKEDRQGFLDEVRTLATHLVEQPVPETSVIWPYKGDLFTLAAIGAFVDVCLIMMTLLPMYEGSYGPLVEELGHFGAVLLIVLLSGLLGYVAYRLTKTGLPHLNARSPAAATAVAQTLIWAFAAWFGATALGWI